MGASAGNRESIGLWQAMGIIIARTGPPAYKLAKDVYGQTAFATVRPAG